MVAKINSKKLIQKISDITPGYWTCQKGSVSSFYRTNLGDKFDLSLDVKHKDGSTNPDDNEYTLSITPRFLFHPITIPSEEVSSISGQEVRQLYNLIESKYNKNMKTVKEEDDASIIKRLNEFLGEEKKLENLKGKCIVREKSKSTSPTYYYGDAVYGSELARAEIFDSDKVPDYIRRNQREEVVTLDSEEGLRIIVDAIHDLEHFASVYGSRVIDAKKGLEKFYNFDLVQKYVEFFNGINGLIRNDDAKTRHDLVERVLREEEDSV